MDVLLMNMGVLLMNLQTLGEGSPVIAQWERFLSTIFLPIWEEKNWWAREENFLLSFPSSLFSFASQTVENTIFHTIFHPLFSILPIIPPTNHSVRVYFTGFSFWQIYKHTQPQRVCFATIFKECALYTYCSTDYLLFDFSNWSSNQIVGLFQLKPNEHISLQVNRGSASWILLY